MEDALEKLKEFLRDEGLAGLAVLVAHPLLLLVRMPARVAVTLWRARILLGGRWERYMAFHPQPSINCLFYRTQAINLQRYGRSGRSPLLGLGDFPLSQWFHISVPGLYAYARAGAVVTVCGMGVWWLSQLLWLQAANAVWVAIVLALTLFSTGFFAMAFVRQNYNVLGWMFLPAGLFAALHGHYALAALAWLAASFSSLTAVLYATAFMGVLALEQWSLAPVVSVIPAGGKFLLNLWPTLKDVGIRNAFAFTAKAIGMTDRRVRYRYTSKRFSPSTAYFILTGTIFIVVYWWLVSPPWLFVAALALFIVNHVAVRFADDQSTILAITTCAVTLALPAPPGPWLALSLWLVLSPAPYLLMPSTLPKLRALCDVEPLEPFDLSQLERRMTEFLQPLAPGQRVLMAFDDPGGVYERLFDGQSALLQLPLYVAAKRGVHFMPDWWAVFETNFEGAPDFWGRSIEAVAKNANRWRADFVVVHQDTGTAIDSSWRGAEFEVCAEFDWGEFSGLQSGQWLWFTKKAPKWWLLQCPSGKSASAPSAQHADRR